MNNNKNNNTDKKIRIIFAAIKIKYYKNKFIIKATNVAQCHIYVY